MQAHDIVEIMKRAPDMVDPDREHAFWRAGSFDDGYVWVGHFRGNGPWTRHPRGDAFMHQLSGRAEITVHEGDGPRIATLIPGQFCVVPAGCWYRVGCADWAAQYGIAPADVEHAEGDAPPAP